MMGCLWRVGLYDCSTQVSCPSEPRQFVPPNMMNHQFMASMLVLGLGFATLPVGAVEYCKSDGVPKGCVARPAAAGAAAGGPYRDRRPEAVSQSPQQIEESGRRVPTIMPRQGQWEKCVTTDTQKCPNTTNSSSGSSDKPPN